jgi:hypothetical protein
VCESKKEIGLPKIKHLLLVAMIHVRDCEFKHVQLSLMGFGYHLESRTQVLNDNGPSIGGFGAGLAPKFHTVIATISSRSQIDDHQSVLGEVEQFPKFLAQGLKLAGGQLAAKNAVLQGISKPFHRLIDFSQSLGVGNIIAD